MLMHLRVIYSNCFNLFLLYADNLLVKNDILNFYYILSFSLLLVLFLFLKYKS